MKNLPANTGVAGYPELGRFPGEKKRQPTPVLLPRKFHGQRSWVGYSPWGLKESDMTEYIHTCKLSYNTKSI